jgi:tetratricopeptide (TPR) repeat protein
LLEGYYLRALSHHSLGEKDKAIADYLQLVHLAVPNEKVERIETKLTSNLASVYYRGLALFHLALIVGPKDWGFTDKAKEFAKRDYLELAAKDFTLVISARPQLADAYYQRGRVRLTSRVAQYTELSESFRADVKGALADFRRAIRLNPSLAEAYFARGEYYESALKPREAILDFARVIKISPGNARAYYMLGELYSENYEDRQLGRTIQIASNPELALNNYSLAIKADPSYVDAYFRRAYLLDERNASQAIADLTQIIRLDPDNANAYRSRARMRNKLKDSRGALEDFTRAIELDPSEPGSNNHVVAFTYVGRAYLRYQLGDGKGAKDDYRQALLIKPCLECTSGSSSVSQANKADAFFQRGLALLRRGDKQGSRQNLEQAARLFFAQGDMAKYQNAKYQLSQF